MREDNYLDDIDDEDLDGYKRFKGDGNWSVELIVPQALLDLLPEWKSKNWCEVGLLINDDAASNSYDGISDTTTLSFTTVDMKKPTLSSSFPENNSTTGNNPFGSILLYFSENILKGTGNINIKRASDDSTFQTVDVSTANIAF